MKYPDSATCIAEARAYMKRSGMALPHARRMVRAVIQMGAGVTVEASGRGMEMASVTIDAATVERGRIILRGLNLLAERERREGK